jgi:hypothetical protein
MQTQCYAYTDKDGILTFNGNLGIYKIRIDGSFIKREIGLSGDGTFPSRFLSDPEFKGYIESLFIQRQSQNHID